MTRALAVGVIALVAFLGGCGGGEAPSSESAALAATPTPVSEGTSARTKKDATKDNAGTSERPSPSHTQESMSESGASLLDCGLLPPDGTLLRHGWDRVTASRGALDHSEWVESFIEDVEDLIDGIEDLPQDQRGACGIVELTQLDFELAVLNAWVVANGEGEDEQYQAVSDAANAWLAKLKLEDEIDPFTSTYSD